MAEIAVEYLAKPILEKIKEYVADHVSYSLLVGDKVESLEAEVKKLKAKRKDVEDKIEAEEPAGMVATKEVEEWLQSAAQLEREAESVISRYQHRNCIFLGSFSFNCWSNHGISAQAIEVKNRVADELASLANIQAFTKLPPPPRGQPVLTDTTLYAETASEIKFKVEEVLDFLRNSVKGMFGIWGMGGIGKTTILKHVNNVLARDPSSRFHRVILVTASRECTVEKLQHLLVEALQIPEGGNLKNKIFNFLSDKNFVILLDDLWERLDLEQVGVPRLGVDENFKHKVILATRSHQVCTDMNVRLTVRVECLSPEKGRRLFREEVGEELIKDNPVISTFADAVADECGGLPKALITVARSMANKSSVKEWVDAAEYLRKSKLAIVSSGTDDPLPLLKISYDYLKDSVLQECLLLCAMWPEDFDIREEDIIECWMGRGLLGEFDTVGEAYKEGERIIDCLVKASLLEKSLEKSRALPRDCVRLHDLIRDMALWITRGDDGANERKWVVLSGVGSDKALLGDKKSWKDADKLSLMRNSLGTLMPSNIQSARNLTDLMLGGNCLRSEELGVIQNLHELKYLDLSGNRLGDFPPAMCQLNKLEYLNLANTELYDLPVELKELTRLKYLLLGFNCRLNTPRGLFSSLGSLEVLDLIGSPTTQAIIDDLYCLKGRLKGLGISVDSQAGLDKLALLSVPIRKLHYTVWKEEDGLTSLHLLPRPIIPNHLPWSDLDYLSLLGIWYPWVKELVIDEGSLPNSLNLWNFPRLKEIIWKGLGRNDMIPKLHRVSIGYCKELKHLNWIVSLPLLKFLSISRCENLKHIIWNEAEEETEGEDNKTAVTLYSLKALDVESSSMETISNGRLHLPSLENLSVLNCGLKKLPFDKISSCSKLKRIRGDRDWWNEILELDEGVRTYLEPCFEAC